ncbi:hypothetical protein DM01DRAFT_1308184 [Hesseltinella vesiculosa]|uniref:CHCH domain-containing protein n=1 Tax=Hesseltinella vesiculosa TaxID=101127 RepID=A0A1X2GCA9_9FUNG|nr:hypothetical protein DM01DRAFT_1308184 [Hesseltinella vesiculosa]
MTDSTDDEKDPYDLRIEKTGCAKENEALLLCYYDKHDWRLCQEEMKRFRACYTANVHNAGSHELKQSEQLDK